MADQTADLKLAQALNAAFEKRLHILQQQTEQLTKQHNYGVS